MTALDITEGTGAIDDVADSISGAEIMDILMSAGAIIAAEWRAQIVGAGLVSPYAPHYAESLIVNPVETKKDLGRVEVAAPFLEATPEQSIYPAVLEYGSASGGIAPTPVALRGFLRSRRQIVAQIKDETGRRVTTRRRKRKKL